MVSSRCSSISLHSFAVRQKKEGLLICSLSVGNIIKLYKINQKNSRESGREYDIEEFKQFTSSIDSVNCLTFSHNECLLATGADNGVIRLFDFQSFKKFSGDTPLHTLKEGEDGSVKSLQFHHNNKLICGIYGRGDCKIWNVKGNCLLKIPLPEKNMNTAKCKYICRFARFIVTSEGDFLLTAHSSAKGRFPSYLTKWKYDLSNNGEAIDENSLKVVKKIRVTEYVVTAMTTVSFPSLRTHSLTFDPV